MKLTKTKLKQIIKEELESISEDMPRRAAGPVSVSQKHGFQGYAPSSAEKRGYDLPYAPSAYTPESTPDTELPIALRALLKKQNNALSRFLNKAEWKYRFPRKYRF